MTNPQPEKPRQPKESPMYQISFERLAQLNRSAVTLIAGRLLPSCPSSQKPEQELSNPKKLVDEIAKHCGSEEGFIRTEMPIQEIVFRTLLSRRNKPTPLRDLHYELTERWATPVRPINLSERGLARVLDNDTYYGFARLSPEVEGGQASQ